MRAVASDSVYRVAVIGGGFGGIGMAWYLRRAGFDDFVVLEKGDTMGGTWRENTYPGSGCDIPSHLYSFSFERDYAWDRRYARQEEIHAYQQHCVRKYDLARHMRYGCEVTAADFDEARGLWALRLRDGGCVRARAVISAVGQLHRPAIPRIPGQEHFQGVQFHSARWRHDIDLRGKRVAVVGTGASAIQFLPEVAKQAARLHLYQRSPGWIVPKVERRFSRVERWLLNKIPGLRGLDRLRIFVVCEMLAYAYNGARWAERIVKWMSGTHMRWQLRARPDLRQKLMPSFPVGCKRILLSSEWLPALTHEHVEVVTDGIEEITSSGIRTADGDVREVDAIIYGTGFTATDFLAPMAVRGLGGRCLQDSWRDGASAYLGMAVPGFPSFFMLYGPNTNLGSGSIIFMLECQQRYITRLLRRSDEAEWDAVDVRWDALRDYAREVDARSARTTYAGDCQSWYKTAGGRNTNNWVGSMSEYARRTRQPAMACFRPVYAVRPEAEAVEATDDAGLLRLAG